MKYPMLAAVGVAAILAACSGKPEPAQSSTPTAQEVQQAIQHAKEAAAQAGKAANQAAAESNENIKKANDAAAAALAGLPDDTKQTLHDLAAMRKRQQEANGAGKAAQ
jgi:hypothetical protein